MAQYIYLANDKYKYFLDQSTGFKMRVGQRNHFFVRDKELYDGGFNDAEDVGWANTGGYGDPGDEVVAGGRIRFGVRGCDWCDDIELTATGFDGVESSPGTSDGDWKCVGGVDARSPELQSAVVEDATPLLITLTYDINLNETDIPDTWMYTIAGGVFINSITISGNEVFLHLDAGFPVLPEYVMELSYDKDGVGISLKSVYNKEASSFSNYNVINNVI